jgi:hypothetical protein
MQAHIHGKGLQQGVASTASVRYVPKVRAIKSQQIRCTPDHMFLLLNSNLSALAEGRMQTCSAQAAQQLQSCPFAVAAQGPAQPAAAA